MANCWSSLPTSPLDLAVSYLQHEDYKRQDNTVSKHNQSGVEVLNAHTHKALAVVCTFWFLVVPALVLATDEPDLPQPPSPVTRNIPDVAYGTGQQDSGVGPVAGSVSTISDVVLPLKIQTQIVLTRHSVVFQTSTNV